MEPEEPEFLSKSRLKKTEIVKRNVEGSKMEEVKLKHHEFEIAPLEPNLEEKTAVKLTKAFPDIPGDKEKKVKKVKKIAKKNEPEIDQDKTADEVMEKEMDIEPVQEETNIIESDDVTPEIAPLEIQEYEEDQCFDDPKITIASVSLEPEKLETDAMPEPISKRQKATIVETDKEEKPKEETPRYIKLEEEKPTKKISIDKKPKEEIVKDEKPLKKKSIDEKIKEEKAKLDKKPKLEKVEEPEMFSKSRLRKVETKKKEIEKPKIEKVALKHHTFEKDAQDTAPEEKTRIKLIGKGEIDEKDKVKKIKKVIKKTKKGKEDEINDENQPIELDDIPDSKEKANIDIEPSFPAQQEENTTIEDVVKVKPSKAAVEVEPTLKEELANKPLKKATAKKPVTKQKAEEPEIFSKSRLKKAETVKREVDGPKMETVDLKHHEFENEPQDTIPEEKTNLKLGKPIKEIDANKKVKKKKKVKSEEPSNRETDTGDEDDIPPEVCL